MNPEFEDSLFADVVEPATVSAPLSAMRGAVLLTALATGTGGSFAFSDETSTSAAHDIVIHASAATNTSGEDSFFTPAARLAIVRRWFSLTMTDVADVMRVQRPTVYAWMASRSTPQAGNLERIRQVHRLARAWGKSVGYPVAKLKGATDGKVRLLEFLCRDHIAEPEVLALFRTLEKAAPRHRTAFSRLASEAGSVPARHTDFDRALDLETLT